MKKVKYLSLIYFICIILLTASVTAISSTDKPSDIEMKGPIVVASKIDTEGALLGQMIIHMLDANGFDTVDKTEFGPTDVIRKAIINGEIDIYPEYTGNGGFFFDNTQPSIWKDAKKGYETVKKLDRDNNDIVWLTPAPANNTWALAIRKDLSKSEGIKTFDDFADYVNSGGYVKVAGSEEFVSRPDALPAFEEAYGFKLSKEQLLILSGGNTAQTEKAAAEQTDGVNAAMAYGTDGALAALGLWVLEDTKGVQPIYEPAPILRAEVYTSYPEIEGILKPVFQSLDLVTLQTLNSRIAIEGQDASAVAKQYLESKGFI
jgi:osmoprotectant transport system substrate-binding protein